MRGIWLRGRKLLAHAAITDIALTHISQFWHHEADQTIVAAVVCAGADRYFLAYVLGARRVRDTFECFPPH